MPGRLEHEPLQDGGPRPPGQPGPAPEQMLPPPGFPVFLPTDCDLDEKLELIAKTLTT